MKQSKTMELKKPVRVSLARQVLTAMESMIRSGKWKVGDRIPAEALRPGGGSRSLLDDGEACDAVLDLADRIGVHVVPGH